MLISLAYFNLISVIITLQSSIRSYRTLKFCLRYHTIQLMHTGTAADTCGCAVQVAQSPRHFACRELQFR